MGYGQYQQKDRETITIFFVASISEQYSWLDMEQKVGGGDDDELHRTGLIFHKMRDGVGSIELNQVELPYLSLLTITQH